MAKWLILSWPAEEPWQAGGASRQRTWPGPRGPPRCHIPRNGPLYLGPRGLPVPALPPRVRSQPPSPGMMRMGDLWGHNSALLSNTGWAVEMRPGSARFEIHGAGDQGWVPGVPGGWGDGRGPGGGGGAGGGGGGGGGLMRSASCPQDPAPQTQTRPATPPGIQKDSSPYLSTPSLYRSGMLNWREGS